MFVRDTLPPYLTYVVGSAVGLLDHGNTGETPDRYFLMWKKPSAVPLDTQRLFYKATPVGGACASQPLFINKAVIIIKELSGDSVVLETNKTYHQGAGIALVTFSASLGGNIYNAGEQALDYKTAPRSGILVVPDEGYEFAGWSHDEYTSMRGKKIEADSSIMHYDDIVIYGNVELRANFVPIVEKLIDKPIEKGGVQEKVVKDKDKVWSANGDLYIHAVKKGAIARIYTPKGILQRELVIVTDDITTVKLERGIYIITLNNGAGYKVRIE
jgi:hypothetical protein